MDKLPIGIQSFEKLRKGDYKYIDKTQYVWDLIESGSAFFLSRPRRFGKSLLLSTVKAYFEGKKELFFGLKISELESGREEKWVPYPVIDISLAGGQFSTRSGLSNILSDAFISTANTYDIPFGEGDDLAVQFKQLIRKLYEKSGQPVVVLVDEYDKPLLENIGRDTEYERANRTLLKAVFSVLKDMDAYLKFIFITGVTKFNKVSVFSDLNQLKDISLMPKYAGICGITENEMREYFRDEVDSLAQLQEMSRKEVFARLEKMYDGYHFSRSDIGVYNPFSLLNAFFEGDFNRYWFESGTPTFLYRLLAKSGRPVREFSDGVTATEARLNNYRADTEDMIPLYYQAGYLTIIGYDQNFRVYTLSYPNDEVKYGYLESLIPMASNHYHAPEDSFSASKMVTYLRDNDMELFLTMLQALLASVPYHEGKTPSNEQQWRNIVYAIFTVLGQYVRTEVHSAAGRSDCIVENEKYVYIFEFKQDKTAEEALNQIEEKNYALPYVSSGKRIVKIGADFSTKIGSLDSWKIHTENEK